MPTATAIARVPQTTQDVYDSIGALLQMVAEAPGFSQRVRELDQVIRFSLSKPVAVITASFPADGRNAVDFATSTLRPDVSFTATTAVAHSFFLGTLNPFLGIDRGDLSLNGDPASLQRFLAITPQLRMIVSPLYGARVDGNLRGRDYHDWRRVEGLDGAALQ